MSLNSSRIYYVHRGEKTKLAYQRDSSSNPEPFEAPNLSLQLEDEHKAQDQHNYSDIKMNMSMDLRIGKNNYYKALS